MYAFFCMFFFNFQVENKTKIKQMSGTYFKFFILCLPLCVKVYQKNDWVKKNKGMCGTFGVNLSNFIKIKKNDLVIFTIEI